MQNWFGHFIQISNLYIVIRGIRNQANFGHVILGAQNYW